MRSNRVHMIVLAGATAALASVAAADDWGRWRGPEGTGVSSESAWSSTGQSAPLWSANVGLGYSSFVISNGRVITAGHDKAGEQDTIYCFDATSGKELWKHTYPSKIWDRAHSGGTLSTPVFDEHRVFAMTREGRFFCLKAEDGTLLWQKDLMDEYDLSAPTWKFAASPLVLGDDVIVNVGRTLCLNKKTGATKWQSKKTGHAYATPHPMEHDGRTYIVVFNSPTVTVFDRTTGEEVASHPWKTQYDINAATPIVMGSRIFISSGYNHGCAMLKFTGDALQLDWENKNMRNKMTGCVLWDGHLYGFDDAILKCVDLEGNEKWRQRGLGMGTIMVADGRLIVISSKGELIVADATPDAYTEHSRAKVLSGGVYWTMPVLANGLIYCRNSRGDVVCMDHRRSDA